MFLTTRLRNVPEWHRRRLAAFNYSWQQLDALEQSAFARLSIFRAGFVHAPAEAVAGAVMWYTGQIYGKLGVKSCTQTLAQARTLNLIA
jgi:hypothetical protein